MKKRLTALILAALMLTGALSGCTEQKPKAPSSDEVVLKIAGGWEDCKAIEEVGRVFTKQYPNCTIQYEYLQDYYASLQKRMTGDDVIDIFFTTNIQKDDEMIDYALDLKAQQATDLSETFEGLINNFLYMDNGVRTEKLYAIPLGAEMRGLYINKTLLDSLNITVPTNQETLLNACKVLKENGYIPFHGNPGDFSQKLLYPWICNLIANADDSKAVFDSVNNRTADVKELFKEPYEFLYTLVENGYYDYKKAQNELNLFNDTTDEAYSRDFFNIKANGDTYEKADDVGIVAFMPATISLKSTMDKTKDDYHSEIEYVFAPAPVGPDGGFAYMSPAHGIAVNKNSAKTDWNILFINFLFQKENNKLFCEEFNAIPNTAEAFNYISTLYDIPDERISHVGEVTFDYDFYHIISDSLLETSKANNPKYMQTAEDGSVSLYPLSYYMNNLEESIKGNE